MPSTPGLSSGYPDMARQALSYLPPHVQNMLPPVPDGSIPAFTPPPMPDLSNPQAYAASLAPPAMPPQLSARQAFDQLGHHSAPPTWAGRPLPTGGRWGGIAQSMMNRFGTRGQF